MRQLHKTLHSGLWLLCFAALSSVTFACSDDEESTDNRADATTAGTADAEDGGDDGRDDEDEGEDASDDGRDDEDEEENEPDDGREDEDTRGKGAGSEDDDDAGAADEGGADAEEDAAALFAIGAQVLTADNPVTYVLLSESFTELPPVEDAALEVPGRALVFGTPTLPGALFVANNGSPEVTKYTMTGDGELSEEATLSMAGEGVTAIGEYQTNMHFLSADKAYYFDGGAGQVVIWNPSEMTVLGAIALPGLLMEGSVLSFSSVPAVQSGDHLVMPAGYRAADGLSVPAVTGAVIIDTSDDSATVVSDDRCGYVRDAVLGDDGMIYLATEVWAAAVHRISADAAPAPCLLRIDPETEDYDADFYIDLGTLADGATLGSLLALPDGTVLTRVLQEDEVTIDETTNARALAGMRTWGFATVTLGDEPEVAPIADSPLILGSFLPLVAGDTIYQPHFDMRSVTELYPLGAEGAGTGTMAHPGLIFSAVQLQ